MAARQPELPHAYGRYELLARLGSGGMASVYLARVRGPGGFEREVAIKITHPHLSDESELVASLLQEARIAARIRHPHVVPVLDVGEQEHGAFLVMEYVEGEVLSAIIRHERATGGRVPLPIALRILADALAGLHAAHELRDERGEPLDIVHRDFTPQNILVGVDGMARLTDFGIARVASESSSTKSGFIKGKLSYLSPEQVRSPRNVDRRTDVWSAGVVAWELVTGQALRDREEEAATLLRIVSEEPARARSVRHDLPQALDDAIARALTMDPARRVATADELRRLLVEAAKDTVPLADTSEVATYVARIAADKLRERRETVSASPQEAETRTELASMARATEGPSAAGRIKWILAAVALAAAGVGTTFVVTARVRRAPAEDSAAAAQTPAMTSVPVVASATPSALDLAASAASSPAPPASSPPPITPSPHKAAVPAHRPPPARTAVPRPSGRPALLDDSLGGGNGH